MCHYLASSDCSLVSELRAEWDATPTKWHKSRNSVDCRLSGKMRKFSVWILTIKVLFQLLLLAFPLQWVWMFSHLNNQCLFISQSHFSHFSPQPKRVQQTMSWMKYKHTAVLLMRPNATFAQSYFQISFKFISVMIILTPQTTAGGALVLEKNIS